MTANQVRCAAANTPLVSTLPECCAHALVAGQPQVIIAAEIKQLAAVDLEITALCRSDDAPPPVKARRLACSQKFVDIAEIGQCKFCV